MGVQNLALELQYKTCYARVLDSKRRFLQAATQYYELSQVENVRSGPGQVSTTHTAIVVHIASAVMFGLVLGQEAQPSYLGARPRFGWVGKSTVHVKPICEVQSMSPCMGSVTMVWAVCEPLPLLQFLAVVLYSLEQSVDLFMSSKLSLLP